MEKDNSTPKVRVPWYGYAAFLVAVLMFSGLFSSADGPLKALDFNVLCEKYNCKEKIYL